MIVPHSVPYLCKCTLVEVSGRDSCHADANNRIFRDFHPRLHLTDARTSRFILTLALIVSASTNKLIRYTTASCSFFLFFFFAIGLVKVHEFVVRSRFVKRPRDKKINYESEIRRSS